ncbi:DUF4259 domain-containing protein [Streptomyces sp. WC2508]|uniref:DUF4259 domain-containing protein n=1 Tax=Streptomyces sp. WC2508 TaxID=3461405 RepID=UPI004044B7EF
MGTWDIGPFDNNTATDFSHRVDEASAKEKAEVLRAARRPVPQRGRTPCRSCTLLRRGPERPSMPNRRGNTSSAFEHLSLLCDGRFPGH